jgi:hypothetical protein
MEDQIALVGLPASISASLLSSMQLLDEKRMSASFLVAAHPRCSDTMRRDEAGCLGCPSLARREITGVRVNMTKCELESFGLNGLRVSICPVDVVVGFKV